MSLDSIAPLALLSIPFVPGYPGSSSSSSRCLSGADRATRVSPHLKGSDSRLPYLAPVALSLRYVVVCFYFPRSSLAFLLLYREDEASMIENKPSFAKRRIHISLQP